MLDMTDKSRLKREAKKLYEYIEKHRAKKATFTHGSFSTELLEPDEDDSSALITHEEEFGAALFTQQLDAMWNGSPRREKDTCYIRRGKGPWRKMD